MCTFSDNLSIIQDKDLLCMQNGTDSLCYDQNCTFPRLLCKGMTQCHIRLIVKSRKTVIKNKYLWMLCNRSCNRKSLLLTTGYIGTALSDRTFIAFRFSLDKFCSLCDLCRFFHFLFCSILISEHDIRSNIS